MLLRVCSRSLIRSLALHPALCRFRKAKQFPFYSLESSNSAGLFYGVAYAARECESTSTRVPAVASHPARLAVSRKAGRCARMCTSTPRVRPVRVACKVEIRRTTPYYVVLAKWVGTDGSAPPASESDP